MASLKSELPSYEPISLGPDADSMEKASFYASVDRDDNDKRTQSSRLWNILHLGLTSVLAVALAVSLACGHDRFPSAYRAFGTYEHGFHTDLHSAKPTISTTTKQFYGGVHLDPNGTYWLSQNPNEPAFIGEPSLELDEVWETHLLRKRYYGLTADETTEQFDDEFGVEQDWIFDLFWVSPATYHNLHCLNYIRKSLWSEYYGIEDTPAAPFVMSHRMHINHCIEQIRQSLMCSLDLTPIPRPWVPAGEIYHADLDRWHTCRDWDSVRGWVDWRNRDFENEMFDNATARWKGQASI